MIIHLKKTLFFFPHRFFLSPIERIQTNLHKIASNFFFFLPFLFTLVGAEPRSNALNEISYTRCARGGLGPVRWLEPVRWTE